MLLAIETSCDESSVALIDKQGIPVAGEVSSQIDLHEKFGGVVPEIASRAHLTNLPITIRSVMEEAKVTFKDLEAIGVTRSPGLVGALLVGVTYAKTLAWLYDLPLIPVDHLEGHLLAPFLDHPDLEFPFLGLVASGGHTHLYAVRGFKDYSLLGKTLDDAVGEAFDKVAKMLGFQYPGGPIVDRIAAQYPSSPVSFPIPFKGKKTLNFSYSGMKTAVRNKALECGVYIKNQVLLDYEAFVSMPESDNKTQIGNIMSGFQTAVIKSITTRIEEALKLTGLKRVVLTGGVAANRGLQEKMRYLAGERGFSFYSPRLEYCTDNAAMIGYVAWKSWKEGLFSDKNRLNLDVSSQSHLTQMEPIPIEQITPTGF